MTKLSDEPIIDPRALWEKYRQRAYGDAVLSKIQEHEVSNAFYAGIEGAFRVIDFYITLNKDNDEEAVIKVDTFRKMNALVALTANPTGKQ